MTNLEQSVRDAIKRVLAWLPDLAFYRYKYYLAHHGLCHFKQPRRFSEKIFHRMRYPAPIFSKLADKVAARSYIANVVGSQYLVPAYLICSHVVPATFDDLPHSFVMKSNHSAGQVMIVHDKFKEDPKALARLANGWLKSDFSMRTREKHYRHIPPKIILEKSLLCGGKPPADYKLNVFNPKAGEPPFVFIQYIHGRFDDMTQDIFLEDCTPAPFMLARGQKPGGCTLEQSPALDEMIRLAKKLAQPFGYLRVDFYLYEGQVYIGELTVTPGAGRYAFVPAEWDDILGDKFGWPETDIPGDVLDGYPKAAPSSAVIAGFGPAATSVFSPDELPGDRAHCQEGRSS